MWKISLREMPPQSRKFWDFECQNAKILTKIARCARQEDTRPVQYQGSASDNEKSEDPAKMTYSIPDFTSRNAKY